MDDAAPPRSPELNTGLTPIITTTVEHQQLAACDAVQPSPITSGFTNTSIVDTANVVQDLFGASININSTAYTNQPDEKGGDIVFPSDVDYANESRAIDEAIRTNEAPSIFDVADNAIIRHSSPSTPHQEVTRGIEGSAYSPIPIQYLSPSQRDIANPAAVPTILPPALSIPKPRAAPSADDIQGEATPNNDNVADTTTGAGPMEFSLPDKINASIATIAGGVNADSKLRAELVTKRLKEAARRQAGEEYEASHREQLSVPAASKAERKRRVRNKSAFVSRHSRKRYETLLENFIEKAQDDKHNTELTIAAYERDIARLKALLEKVENHIAIPPRQF